ncbi:hypothetical protein VSR68_10365 [Paraburkholderia phymatum]|uniref:hypothetical protein n=1 Tax=Paraburkholderia phymatum TaxID=148447 RepID=UPI00317BEFC2
MKIVQFLVAAFIAFSAVSSFAQSTPPTLNDDVRAQLTHQKMAYRYSDSGNQAQAPITDAKRTAMLPHQITGVNLGRYSLSVVRPAF